MSASRRSLWKDESGSSLIEMTVGIVAFLLILFGVIDFSFALYQWNEATKAVQYGARVAAVSNPVANDLMSMTGLSNAVLPGDPMPTFVRECTSNSASAATGSCTSGGSYNAAAMRRIVFGATGRTSCQAQTTGRDMGMCHLFGKVTPLKVRILYQYTGLGYAGRPGGPVPTITVSLRDISYSYIFLNGLAGLIPVNMPAMATTVTGEDLKKSEDGT